MQHNLEDTHAKALVSTPQSDDIMSEHTRIAALSAQIAQMHQDMEYWRRHERDVAAKLDTALARLQQYTRHGQHPDPIVSAAVNNHSVALNKIRSTMAGLQSKKAAAEGEYAIVSRRVGKSGC